MIPVVKTTFARELRLAKSLYGRLSPHSAVSLREFVVEHDFSIARGDLTHFGGGWYVTHAGLLGLAQRRRCSGIHTGPVMSSSNATECRWVFRAIVFKSRTCKGFAGYGDADPTNVSAVMHGAEMRVAETRAVNRALRKAYGVGICSVEEIGSFARPQSPQESKKLPPQRISGNYGSPKLRDRLCQLIRHYQLDATLVKSYAIVSVGRKLCERRPGNK